ncbi:hypothetical protein F5I97DRAFT_1817824, partial [Phlebopus sp. FC_14]
YMCSDCLCSPLFCSTCCRAAHMRIPLHRVTQWNGTFFEESSLKLVGLVVHLGHNGQPCPNGYHVGPRSMSEEEWKNMKMDRKPLHL